MARIAAIMRFPVKGLAGEALDEAILAPGTGIPGDRALAFRFADAPVSAVDKRHFMQLVNTPACAALRCRFDAAEDSLEILEGNLLIARGAGAAGAPGIAAAVSAWRRRATGEARDLLLARARYPDVPDCDLSLLHLASLAQVNERAGLALEAERFRMNLLIEGDEAPQCEAGWTGRSFRAGGAVVVAAGALPRCPAPDVNPATAIRDVDLPGALARHLGHVNLGALFRVVRGGRIRTGDRLEPLGDRPPP